MELSYLKSELINAYGCIYEMYDNEEYDLKKVNQIISNMAKPDPLPFHSQVIDGLQMHMNYERFLAVNCKDNPEVKCYFGLKYLHHKLWNIIRNEGIGSLLKFQMKSGMFIAEIRPYIYLEKNEFEDEDSYEKRKDEFLKHIPYDYIKNKITRQLCILDNDKNRNVLFSKLKEWFSILRYKISSHDGLIDGITLYCSDVFVTEKKNQKINTDRGKIESVLHSLKECIASINTCLDFPSLKEHTLRHIASSVYSICVNLGICQEYIDSYEKISPSNRDINRNTNDLITEIGSKVSTLYIKDVFKKFSLSIYEYMENKYAMHCDIYMDSNGISLDMYFSSSMLYASKTYLLDNLRDSDISDMYIISYKHLDEVKDILKRNSDIDVSNIEIKTYQSGTKQYMYIYSMNAFVTDILRLFEICGASPNM